MADTSLPPAVTQAVKQAADRNANFVSAQDVQSACEKAGLPAAQTSAIVGLYEKSQISALKTAFAGIALFVLLALVYVRRLPTGAQTKSKGKAVTGSA